MGEMVSQPGLTGSGMITNLVIDGGLVLLRYLNHDVGLVVRLDG